MKELHWLMLAFTLATAAAVCSGPVMSARADQTRDPSADRPTHPRAEADDNEHGAVEPHGIEINWVWPAKTPGARLATPWMTLELRNIDPVLYEIQVRTLEDAGSLQSRRVSDPVRTTLFARDSLELPISFGADLRGDFTHSGMVVAVVTACPMDGGCITGTSAPLYFHPDGGGFLIYDEALLCRRFRCGALAEPVRAERGTRRVMGGGPLHEVPSQEESDDEDDDRVVDGGDV
jgi:hypothetical protein